MQNDVTPEEEEAWSRLEQKMIDDVTQQAISEAYKFTHDFKNELGIFTLRKAYEMGFIRGYNARGKK